VQIRRAPALGKEAFPPCSASLPEARSPFRSSARSRPIAREVKLWQPFAIDPRVSGATADFVSQLHQMYIDGRFVQAASGKNFPVYNPATGDVVTEVPEAEEET